jgi:hypothetical protein
MASAQVPYDLGVQRPRELHVHTSLLLHEAGEVGHQQLGQCRIGQIDLP